MECIDICPEKNAIGFSLFSGKFPVNHLTLALIFSLLFTMGILIAQSSGKWQNKISKGEYLDYSIQSCLPLNINRQIDPEKMAKMIKMMKNIQPQGDSK